MNSTSPGYPSDFRPRMAVMLPESGAEELLRILLDADPDALVLDPATGVDPLASGRESGATLLVIHEDIWPDRAEIEASAPGTAASEPRGPMRILLLLDGSRGGDPAARIRGADSYFTLPCSPPLLVAACRALLAGRLDRAGNLRARPPRAGASRLLYDEAKAAVERVLAAVAREEIPDLSETRLIAERIHTSLLHDNGLVNRSLEPHTPYDLPGHSTNVGVIAGKLALGMALPSEDIVRAIQAGLVHDLGMARLPGALLANPGKFTEEERQELRTHPQLGAEALEPLGPRYEWLQRVVLQEHERRQGQGYPLGLTGGAIDPLARLVSVADVFEALSHPRTYRSPNTALEALEQVASMGSEWFDPGVVAALVNEISAFPLDAFVQLTTGEIARVLATNPDNLFRPQVEVLWDPDWKRIDPPQMLDLSKRAEVTVARMLLESELPLT
ncbi:MAG: HD-GYP domain-containing protein [Gemmatimonadota bacterium]